MDDHEWMYTGWTTKRKSDEWVRGTNNFLEQVGNINFDSILIQE
jgi:hypothetical protein